MSGEIVGIRDVRAFSPSVVVGSSCTVRTATYDADIVSVASQYVNRSFDHYVFFQIDDSTYALMFPESASGVSTFSLHDVDTLVFRVTWETVTETASRSFSGSATTVSQNPSTSSFTGSYTDSFSYRVPTYETYHIFLDSYTLDCQQYLVYTDLSGSYPDLREGVCYYAFAGFVVCALICCFKLFDRIFKRLY